ncbi:MAG: arylamine N-acetyltransferase [Candidatus Anstonellales archaeon]
MKLKKALAGLLLAGSLLLVPTHSSYSPTQKEYYYTALPGKAQPNTVCIELSKLKEKAEGSRMKNVDEIFKEVLAKANKLDYNILEYKDKHVLNAKKVEKSFKEGSCLEKSALALQWLRENGYDANLAALAVYLHTDSKAIDIRSKHIVVLLYLDGKRYILDPTHEAFFESGEELISFLHNLEPRIYKIKVYPFERVSKPVKLSDKEERMAEDVRLPQNPEKYSIGEE